MDTKSLGELTDEALLRKHKELKNGKIVNAVIVGFTIGIFIYGAVNNGLGFFTFLPLFIAYLIVKSSANAKMLETEIKKELDSRSNRKVR